MRFRFLHQDGGRLSNRARERVFDALTDAEVENVERIYKEVFGGPPAIRSMSDLDIALQNREVVWPVHCKKAHDGQHRIAKVAARQSEIHSGWTYKGVCGLCRSEEHTSELQ